MSILCGQQNGWSVIYMLNIRNNYSHYCLITTNSDPPTPSDMVSCLLSLNIEQFSIQTEEHLADLLIERQDMKYFQHGRDLMRKYSFFYSKREFSFGRKQKFIIDLKISLFRINSLHLNPWWWWWLSPPSDSRYVQYFSLAESLLGSV